MKRHWIGLALAMSLLGGAASAATLHFTTSLKGSDETPPNDSKGTGKVTATLDTGNMTLKYKVTYGGLSGPATMAHFHGPAAAGADAPPVVAVPAKSLASPMTGSATLNAEQVGQLEGGKWYFNIHTAAHPGGELRGQMEETPSP